MPENPLQLMEEQNEIIILSEGQHLVLAPPGTGKTELLAQSKNGNQFPRTRSPFLDCIAHHFKSYNL